MCVLVCEMVECEFFVVVSCFVLIIRLNYSSAFSENVTNMTNMEFCQNLLSFLRARQMHTLSAQGGTLDPQRTNWALFYGRRGCFC